MSKGLSITNEQLLALSRLGLFDPSNNLELETAVTDRLNVIILLLLKVLEKQ